MTKERKNVPAADQWNLKSVYKINRDWEIDFKKLQNNLKKLEFFKGKLNQPIAVLKCLKLSDDLERLLGKLSVFALSKKGEIFDTVVKRCTFCRLRLVSLGLLYVNRFTDTLSRMLISHE